METYSSLSIALVIIFGGKAVIDGDMSVGSFFAFLTAIGFLFDPIKKVSSLLNRMQDGVSATERVIDLLNVESSIKSGTIQIGSIEKVEFRGVHFQYGDREVLRDIDFSISQGENIALVGDSGGGKSTILSLLLRFYDRSRGTILINEIDIKEISLFSLRNEIAFVSQRVYIFNDTIINNVAYGDEVNEKRVIEALKMAEAFEFVSKMENGIYTQLQEFGANLSGGQRQRIAFARAIYRDASILILDEATSALDNRVEKQILENLQSYFKERIVLTVAHRLSTIHNSDQIFLFSNGHIVGKGKHEDLLKFSSEYQRLNSK
jgi:subfamily B ATP-binding cassette protein MsbA